MIGKSQQLSNRISYIEYTGRLVIDDWYITGFVTRVTRRVPIVQQELLTLPEYLSSSPALVGFVLLDLYNV